MHLSIVEIRSHLSLCAEQLILVVACLNNQVLARPALAKGAADHSDDGCHNASSKPSQVAGVCSVTMRMARVASRS